jgi:hypothetical protein
VVGVEVKLQIRETGAARARRRGLRKESDFPLDNLTAPNHSSASPTLFIAGMFVTGFSKIKEMAVPTPIEEEAQPGSSMASGVPPLETICLRLSVSSR